MITAGIYIRPQIGCKVYRVYVMNVSLEANLNINKLFYVDRPAVLRKDVYFVAIFPL